MVTSQTDDSRTRAAGAGALTAAAAAHPSSGGKQQQRQPASSSKQGSPAGKRGQPHHLDSGSGSPLRSGLQQQKQKQQQQRQQLASSHEPLIPASRPDDAGVEERANDLQHYATELQSVTARLAGYAAALRHGGGNEPQQLLTVELPAMAAAAAALAGASAGASEAASPASSFNLKLADPSHIAALRDQLALSNSLVQQRAQSASPTKQPGHAAAAAAAGGHGSSRISHRLQPQQGSSCQQQQQQPQVPHAASTTKQPGALAAAVSALMAGSTAPQQLLLQQYDQQQRQPQQQYSQQELAAAGLRQMQQVTEVTHLLQPTIAAHRAVVDEVAPKLQQLQRVLHANPQLADPGGLSALVTRLSGLEREVRAEQQARAASDEALTAERRALQALELAHNNTLKVLQQQTHTPRDTRCAALQAANSSLEQALLRKGAEIEALRAELLRSRQQRPTGSGEDDGELSPVRPEGQRYDDPGSSSSTSEGVLPSGGGVLQGPFPSAAGQHLCVGGGSDNTSSSGTTGGGRSSVYGSCSRSGTPGSDDSSSLAGSLTAMQRLQQQQQQGPARYSAGVQPQQRGQGAAQQQAQQQQVSSLRRHVSAGAEGTRQQPGSLGEALQMLQDQGGMIQALQRQLHLQEQEAAALRAQGEASFRRQLEVEKRQHMHTKQAGELLRCQAEQLQQQLADARAREATAQAAAAAAADGHAQRQRHDDGGSSGGHAASAAAWQQQSQRLQVHIEALKAENGAMQQCLHSLYSHIRGAGQLASAPLCALASAGGDGGNLMLQLEVSVQRLLADATTRQAAAASEQQQLELLQHDNSGLRQQVSRLQQQNEALERHNAACKAEVQRQTDNLLRTEHVLLKLQEQQGQQAGTQFQALAQQCRQLQQALDDARAEAAAAQQAAAAATAAAQQQAASAATERGVLMDRVRQLADMAAQAESRRSSSNASTMNGPETQHSRRTSAGSEAGDAAHQQQQQRLQQELFTLRCQLAEAQGKEERLQVANAQMQERLVRLQVAAASGGGGHASEQQQQHEGLQAAVTVLEQENQQLQQQLAAAAGRDQQQQQQQAPVSSELEQQVLELQDALEQRTRELDEWQTHADALECDLEDMKDRVQAAEEAAATAQEQLAASCGVPPPGDSSAGQQQQLAAAKARLRQLEHDLHGAQADRAALSSRLEAATAELGTTRQAAADLRLRLEHFTGPSGPQARLRQLEASLQHTQRRADAADARAATAAADVASLTSQLGKAEGEIVALEGHISVLEDALAAQQ